MHPGSSLRSRYGPAAMILLTLLWLAMAAPLTAEAKKVTRSPYSRAEINWAITWINNALPKFMKKGIIEKISTKKDRFEVFAGKPWYGLTFNQQGAFLKNLARAREIIGHAPYFSVSDISSSETVARVSGPDIKILIPGQGLTLYMPREPYFPQPPVTWP